MDRKYKNLQKVKTGSASNAQRWSLENIKDGLLYFYDLYNHYPNSREIDKFDFLPSARSMQRTYGGLVKIRKQLLNLIGSDTDHRTGKIRSKQAKDGDRRAAAYEEEFYKFLISKIPEVRVHEHKIIRPGNISSDFFIYTNDPDGIVLDLFYAKDIFSVAGIVNIKSKRYLGVIYPVYFIIVGNNDISQDAVNKMLDNKKRSLPNNLKVYTEIQFKNDFDLLIAQ